MEGTISGEIPDEGERRVRKVKAWWAVRKCLTRRTMGALMLAAAIGGGLVEKSSTDATVTDLQAQIAAMQDSDSTGASGQVDGSGQLVSKKTTGSPNVTHPKALSPSQHKYQCTRIG